MSYNVLQDPFFNCHTHSEMSNIRLKDCTIKVKDAILYVANTLGQTGYTLTDHENMSNHLKVLNTVKELKGSGKIPNTFKVGLGNEIYLIEEEELNNKLANKEYVSFYHFILIALDDIGHRQLRELSSRAWDRMFNYKGLDRVPTFKSDIEEIIGSNKGHVIGSTACLGGELSKSILIGDIDRTNGFINWCQTTFGDTNFYLEMQPHDPFLSVDGVDSITEQEVVNTWIAKQGLPTIITTDAHYLKAEDRKLHEAYLRSDEDEEVTNSGGREVGEFYATTYFMGINELRSRLNYLSNEFFEDCVHNTYNIYERINFESYYNLFKQQDIMRIPLPPRNEWYWHDELVDLIEELDLTNLLYLIDDTDDCNNYLASLWMQGFEIRNIPREEWKETLIRLDEEMENLLGISVAKNVTMSAYFILMHKFIDIIWEQANSIVGVSRGSAGGWILNYLLGIVQINPLKQPAEMPLWRFLSSERPDFADIDIDLASHKRDIVFEKVHEYIQSIGGDIVRVGTFKTESAKSAIQTSCRGLGIPSDIGVFISSLIPINRGKTRSLHDTYYGNADEGIPPVTEFVNQVNKYDGLLETALGIENLISGRSSHACGVVFSLDMVGSTAIMRTPNNEVITQYDLGDCEQSGLIKFDFLCTKTCAMLQIALEMLVEYGHMEWQGTLRKTYDKYLHPDVINPDSPEYYVALNNNELLSAFQFDSMAGEKALKTINPHSLLETANANSLMRLMADDGEQPMDMYARYKADPNEWEQDMIDFGLDEYERSVLHRHLDKDFGVCSSQEGMMLLSMDEEIAGFNVKESNVLRKSVAKKKPKLLQQSMELLYEKGLARGCREVFLKYIWDVQIAMQRGYSFSILHTTGYSWILVQQLHLITHYPSIYWNTAVLQIESGAIEQDHDDDETDGREKTTNYEAIGGAIAMVQHQGVEVGYPDINKAINEFAPDEKNNVIRYGFKSINGMNNATSKLIIENRPFSSLRDFYDRMCVVKQEVTLSTGKTQMKSLVSNKQIVNLIKAGAFDELEGKPRKEIMAEYVRWTCPSVSKLTVKHIDTLIDRGMIGEEFDECIAYYDFKAYLTEGRHIQDSSTKSIKWYLLDGEDAQDTDYCVNKFFELFPELIEGRHWKWADDVDDAYGNPIWVAVGGSAKLSFEGIYKAKLAPLTAFMKTPQCLSSYNKLLFTDAFKEYERDSRARWEMESMCMYHDQHELAHIDKELYSVINFHDLNEEPEVVDWWTRKDKDTGEEVDIPKFRIDTIVGTVLGRNKTRHTVTLLTESGIVNVKMEGGKFSFYDKQISVPNEQGGKTIVERSWFTRGNILMVHGIRRGDVFRAKVYRGTSFAHSINLVSKVYEDGYLMLEEERYRIDD